MARPTQGPHLSADGDTVDHLVAGLYVRQRRALHLHAGAFVAGITIILVVNLATNLAAGIADQRSAWWSVWAFIGWSLGIATHGLVVRLNRPASGSSSGQW